MILELALALVLGILIGCLTGLTPGIHINLVAAILLSASQLLLEITSPISLSVFIISMSINHTFIDYIPSIFLGAPDENSFLSILPGHQFLLKGKAYEAVILSLYGSLFALPLILIFTPIFIYILPKIYPYIKNIMFLILILISLYLVCSEKDKKLWALIVFLLAGFLGIATLNLNIKDPLLPLLSGLFGTSSLIISIQQKTIIPQQTITKLREIKLEKISFLKASFASIIASPFMAFLPGMGSSQAALIGKEISYIEKQDEFLFLLGAINTLVLGLSFVALYSIQKTRTGAAVAVSKLLPELTINHLLIILTTIFISGIIAGILGILLSKFVTKIIHKIKYSKLSLIILIILITIVILFSDFSLSGRIISLFILITSTSLGIFAVLIGIKRMHLMGCLLLPTILFFLI